ncbi:PEP/pyruvate-binding domain-containing protein [Streptomyces sp. NPDC004658]|uniref:PEP/pyruvate-binding domain-containing protein n=1 Tax=Streptomyces sp. NPDC004658 TaxID=3154672 RepID=UPI0033ACC8E2
MAGLLGGKGAGLAEMTRLGLPVPPGFTVTTEACDVYLATGQEPPEPGTEEARALAGLERAVGRWMPNQIPDGIVENPPPCRARHRLQDRGLRGDAA